MYPFINQVLNLPKFIAYSQDAVVSKTIYKSESTILTLFALAKGQNISEHVTPFNALIQILEGELEVTIGGVKSLLATEEGIIMPANVPHALHARHATKALLTMMK